LFTYPLKVENGKLLINAGQMPTLKNKASLDCPSVGRTESAQIVARIEPCQGNSPGTSTSTIG
jgi:uncharacterized membrane protein affecting hemolysin expression